MSRPRLKLEVPRPPCPRCGRENPQKNSTYKGRIGWKCSDVFCGHKWMGEAAPTDRK